MERIFSHRLFVPLSFVFLAVVTFAAYSGSMHTPFQFDGVSQIKENAVIRDLGNIGAILHSNRPVTVLTFALNYAAGGVDTFGYHIVNVSIHTLNACLAFLLVTAVLGLAGYGVGRARRVGFFAALLFALHPVQTQAVTYIIQRMELLGSLFYLAALLLFVRGAARSERGHTAAGWVCNALVVAAFVLGFYSKEIVITLPAVVFLFDVLFVSRLRIKPVLGRAPLYAVLVALLCWFAYSTIVPGGGFSDVSSESVVAAAPARAPAAADAATADALVSKGPSAGFGVGSITSGEYLMTQFNVLTYYMTLLVYPANQNIDYDFPISTSLFAAPPTPPGTALNYPQPPAVVSFVVLAAMLVVAIWLIMRSTRHSSADKAPYGPGRAIAFFILWYFIILAPTSSIVPIYDVLFEHRLYLPSLGFIAIALMLVDRAIERAFGAPAA